MRVFLALAMLLVARAGAWGVEPVEVKISVLPGLKYDVQRFAVAPGAPVKITLRNPDQMIHNLVITQPGARLEVVMAALALGADGPAKNFVPDSPKVLHHTRALNPTESQELKFDAPREEGVYPYVCTFTGHGLIMYGAMYVTTKPLPPLVGDPNLPPTAPAIEDAADHSHHALTRPVVSRTFLPDCGPAAVAIGLPGGQSYCFDAGLCRLRYAWRGGFVDNSEHWIGKGEAMGKVVGRIYYRAPDYAPLRIGGHEPPALRWRGYQLRDGYPQLEYTVDGVLVRETAHALPAGSGLEFTYEIEAGSQPVTYTVDPTGGAAFASSVGRWENGVLTLTATEARHFTLTVTERPGVEPLAYWSMNDLLVPGKKDPPPGVIGRAFSPVGVDGKPKAFDTGIVYNDLLRGGTVMLWYKVTDRPKQEESALSADHAILRVGENAWINSSATTSWLHAASTFDGQTIRSYRDGTLVGDGTPIASSTPMEGHILLGGPRQPKDSQVLIDEVRIYDRALSSVEVKNIYDREAAFLPAAERPH